MHYSCNRLVFLEHALKLWNGESVVSVLFQSGVLGWNWSDVVEYTLVDAEVHEGDSELLLDLGLFLDVLLDNHAHLLNSVHFSLLGDVDPVFELLVEVEGGLSSLLELVECPVSDLHKSVPQNSFLNSDAFSHFLNILTLFDLLFLFLSGATLLGILALSSFSFTVS